MTGDKISIFPNPANDGLFNIELHKLHGMSQLKITDVYGKTVEEVDIAGKSDAKLQMNLNTGVYLIILEGSGEKLVKKVIVD
nr:T9SS type A sorting domain-containing protein [Fulvivirga sediminis]